MSRGDARAAARAPAQSGRLAEHGFNLSRRSAEHGFESFGRSAEHGFTLIEMLVALAVFGIAALALLRLEGASVATAARLQDHLIGEIVARNVAVEAVTDPLAPPRGDTNGTAENAGRRWTWTRAVTDAGNARVQRIDVRVTTADGQPAGTVTMFRGAS